jgi:hypothetical protein
MIPTKQEKKPLTEREEFAYFFLCLAGIVVGIVFMFWATTDITTLSPYGIDVARIAIVSSGAALMASGVFCLFMMEREVGEARPSRDFARVRTTRPAKSPTSS